MIASDSITLVQMLVNTVAIPVGLGLLWYARRAYKRTHSRSLQLLAIGFGLFVLGSVVGGLVPLVVGLDRSLALVFQSLCSALGVIIIGLSLLSDPAPVESVEHDAKPPDVQ